MIYGPNTSGKTNIIAGMDVFREIVLRGNIKNTEHISSSNISNGCLELIPNHMLTKPKPTRFILNLQIIVFCLNMS